MTTHSPYRTRARDLAETASVTDRVVDDLAVEIEKLCVQVANETIEEVRKHLGWPVSQSEVILRLKIPTQE